MKKLIRFFILIVLVFWLVACEQKAAIEASGKTVKIGIIAPFSGSHDSAGKEGLKGMETAIRGIWLPNLKASSNPSAVR